MDRKAPGTGPVRHVVFGLTALVVFALVDVAVVANLLRSSFHMDIWSMILHARSWHAFLAAELADIHAGERIRPVVHLVVAAYVRTFGIKPAGLAVFFWCVAIAVHGLVYAFLRRLDFRWETALLTALTVLIGPAVIGTCYAHQYNDLVVASFFTFLVLVLCLRDEPARLVLVLPLCVLGMLSHESGALVGALLLVAHAYRSGIERWRKFVLRRDTLAVVLLCAGYLGIRSAGHSHLIGATAIARNLLFMLKALFGDLRLLFPVCGVAALVLARRSKPRPGTWVRLSLVAMWPLCAYALYLLNVHYQSATYLTVALVLPTAALVDPLVGWLFGPLRRSWVGALGAGLLVLLAAAPWLDRPLPVGDRFVGPVLRTIVAHSHAMGARPVEVWLAVSNRAPNAWGRSNVADQLAIYGGDKSLALAALVPERHPFPVHVIGTDQLATVTPRPGDLVLAMVEVVPHQYCVWRIAPGGAASAPIYVPPHGCPRAFNAGNGSRAASRRRPARRGP